MMPSFITDSFTFISILHVCGSDIIPSIPPSIQSSSSPQYSTRASLTSTHSGIKLCEMSIQMLVTFSYRIFFFLDPLARQPTILFHWWHVLHSCKLQQVQPTSQSSRWLCNFWAGNNLPDSRRTTSRSSNRFGQFWDSQDRWQRVHDWNQCLLHSQMEGQENWGKFDISSEVLHWNNALSRKDKMKIKFEN